MENLQNDDLLRSVELRLKRIEKRQKRQTNFYLGTLLVFVLALAVLAAVYVPKISAMVRQYNALMSQVQEIGQAVSELDLNAVSTALSSLEGVDVASLEKMITDLESIDFNQLKASLDFLQEVDLNSLNASITQLKSVLGSLSKLNTESINQAVENLNKALEPVMKLFE